MPAPAGCLFAGCFLYRIVTYGKGMHDNLSQSLPMERVCTITCHKNVHLVEKSEILPEKQYRPG